MTLATDTSPPPETTLQLTNPLPPQDAERLARLRLARSANVGPRTYAHLMHRYGSGVRALAALPDLAAKGGRRGYVPCPAAEAEAEIEAGQAAGAKMLLIDDPDYPALLAQIDSTPPVLWVMSAGPTILTQPAVAIVGARNASALGLRAARNLARELGAQGHVIVSGLARGIDSAAHYAALETGTVAVMAGGVDHIYPPENADLAARIAEEGALISECPPGTEPTSRHFPRRNRLISGLASGVVLIEAAARSGSLITARYALEQGREAMACPGAPEDPRSGGCNQLIRDGAALIRNAEDVLEALAAPRTLGLTEPGQGYLFEDEPQEVPTDVPADSFDFHALDELDEGGPSGQGLADLVVELAGPTAIDIDAIARECQATPTELSLVLLELELAGRIAIHPGGRISRAA